MKIQNIFEWINFIIIIFTVIDILASTNYNTYKIEKLNKKIKELENNDEKTKKE
ncbi:hypothetical protein [Candidatus Phytoplasma pruni]|uniref:Uncharacterized protein n=1 Tax=Candidatus Phytoplasma pruni TaxID=479893 RepID=A0A851HHU9_9MOLU|nr:hypothetical protein [Candidatus Phytoplasma pruni]NWN45874.1 hypothetical protein [Candidatus Phytoplasma pruni]